MDVSLFGTILGRDEKLDGKADDRGKDELLVNAYATVRDLPALDFPHRLMGQRDLSDPDMPSDLDAFVGYVFGRGDGQMTAMHYHLWGHIRRVRNQVNFVVALGDLPAVTAWARSANAILFLGDGSVRAPDMAMLMNAEGVFNDKAGLPYPPDAIARRARTLKLLGNTRPAPPASMPPCFGEAEAALRPASEVFERALGLFCVAAQGVAVENGDKSVLAFMREQNPIGINALTPQERIFLEAENPDAQTAVQMSWRYEALNVLLWTLSIGPDHLDPAGEIADVNALVQRVLDIANDKSEVRELNLRPAAEILDALDLTWRQHWITRQARLEGVEVETLNPSVVMERHHALNWITGFQNDRSTDWDNIDTPT
ncbi:DUF4272 domain-containing protein [Bradyrhizobium sp.]|uniref:DUF4272 domain-containing protein n=1 Tax=Bradyrhizobium sp. TaxID=376 RepID=UPI001EBD33EE|nr:DUF4272 domain-containing protein [Bradyrhizobium sp.]MBV8919586.1 DUF4272 domain-containing protein [Bradyrhizobium sp.]MBV9981014.1 DUF4272 domain-containing protein [Bradyrhizobium sp.]